MEKILIFIKHHFSFLWTIIEWGNGVLFNLFYKRKMDVVIPKVFLEKARHPYSYRVLIISDAEVLSNLISSQVSSDLKYFSPHSFDTNSVRKQFGKNAFLMMGVFDKDRLIGYFFLRFFANRKCFVGRLIDKEYRGRGIGDVMNRIMYNISWRMGFRCLSTISKNNQFVMQAHAKNSAMVVLKELSNDYLLVEFVKETSDKMKN